MSKVSNVEIYGLESSIFRSGYAMMDKAPSQDEFIREVTNIYKAIEDEDYGNPHIKRAIKLANAKGGGHDQFLTGIVVNFDLTISNKAWVEAERYTFLNFITSMSTMHRVAMFKISESCNSFVTKADIEEAERLQEVFNSIDGDTYPDEKRAAYLDLLYNLPAGFEITAGMTTNYRCLKNIYAQRRFHRLPDWHTVCNWVETLPLADMLITGQYVKKQKLERNSAKVICIGGKARAGKDTTAEEIKRSLEKDGHKVLIAHYADLVKYVCKQFFEWNGEKDEAGRTLLQKVGTDIVRKQRPQYWVDFVVSILELFPNAWEYVIIPDCRFPNEIAAIKNAGFKTKYVRIERNGFDNGLTEEQKSHPSETALDKYIPDHYIYNNGSMEDLRGEVERFIAELYGIHQVTVDEASV